jgi:hypothetical protein
MRIRIFGLLLCALLAGCVGGNNAVVNPDMGAAPPRPAETVAPPETAKPATSVAVAPPAQPAIAAPAVTPAPAPAVEPSTVKPAFPARAPEKVVVVPKEAPKPAVATPAKPAVQTLDLKALEKRLKDTSAIGVFTKLALKNQVDDLLEKVKLMHQGRVPPTAAQIRQAYDLLLMKVLTLLQDGDPPLAREVSVSREPLWGILSDPVKFASIN